MKNNLYIQQTWRNNNAAATISSPSNNAMTLLEQPAELRAAENRVSFVFQPNILNSGAQKYRAELRVDGNIAAGTSFNMTSTLAVVSIPFSNFPTTGEAYTHPSASNAVYKSQVAQLLADELNRNSVFAQFYTANVINNTIIIEALATGDEYNITFSLPTNLNLGVQTFGGDKYYADTYRNYQLFMDVFTQPAIYGDVLDKSLASFVGRAFIPYEKGKNIEFSIENLLKIFVDTVLPTKTLSANVNYVALDQTVQAAKAPVMLAYFGVWGDAYAFVDGGDIKNITQGVTSVRYIQNASFDSLNPYDLQKYVWHDNVTPFDFLTESPNFKEIGYDSHEFLQFIRKKGNFDGEWGICIRVRYNDNTVQTIYRQIGVSYANLWGNISMDVSPSAIGLQIIEQTAGKEAVDYSVSVYYKKGTSINYESSRKTYKIRRQCHEKATNILFLNNLGAWDTIDFRGLNEESINRTATLLQRSIPVLSNRNSVVSNEISVNTNISTEKLFKLYTIIVKKDFYKWSQSLFKSTAVFMYDETLMQYTSVIIEDYNYQFNENEDTYILEVTLKRGVKEQNITR